MTTATRKCLVWDLDNTLWDGVCLEGDVELRPEVPEVLATLDRRGILHSIASRGEEEVSSRQLAAFGLSSWFLAPRINWLPKPFNLDRIAAELGIGVDALAFVDDDPFEREHMAFMRPEVLVLDAANVARIPGLPEFNPEAVTTESARRRQFYLENRARQDAEAAHGDRQAFLAACAMELTVRRPVDADVPRIRELMTRTHQLNTTGLQLEAADIDGMLAQERLRRAGGPQLLVADFQDRFGSYGTVGVAITEADAHRWRLIYLAMSCRILGRGVESAFLQTLLEGARRRGYHRLEATLRDTGRNGSMRALYQMAGLVAAEQAAADGIVVFATAPARERRAPAWVTVRCESC